MTDPLVAARIRQGAGAYSSTLDVPTLRSAEGVALLERQAAVEANVLAHNDVFILIGVLATATTIYLAIVALRRKLREHRAASLSHPAGSMA